MTDPVERLVGFVHALRAAGVAASPSRGTEFLRAAALLPPEDLYWAGRHTLVSAAPELGTYDRVFVEYFGGGPGSGREQPIVHTPEVALEQGGSDEDEGCGENNPDHPASALASEAEVLQHKSFAEFSREELERLAALLQSLDLAPPCRRTRRWKAARRGDADPRRTVRAALRSGGEPVQRAWRHRHRQPRRLILILDVSHSMSEFSRALLLFARAGLRTQRKAEVFCFGTRLTPVTDALSGAAAGEALMRAAAEVVDWDGGTRIGESLKHFLDHYGHAGLARGAIVMICSDGLEQGDPELLGEQMARLSRLAHQVLWLNPLKESAEYEPLARGMAAALPYIDVFASGHNLASLEEIAALLTRSLGASRPARR
ncbi:vWA domain-containing protein (plasmid) [Pseudonocardia bannensis]|uniref:VWA domain-containing protein n=1 Tax=Pseudonocardia bannensis TaxID=630973 RepID=A0A848DN42_9PSEU|nr:MULTISPECIES: VWA domain-containing protein [Pseudonocardia]NMH94172.1 VWA domain-containing protein [Pseudonocardia bannensis]